MSPFPISQTNRSGRVESRHFGTIAVSHRGKIVFQRGDLERPVFARSTLKAMQLLPLLEDGVAERYDITDEELAVMASSHDGSPYHVSLVEKLIGRTQLPIQDFQCGIVPPLASRHHRDLIATGGELSVLHNDCSGKHAGLLLQARNVGIPSNGYLDPGNPVQRRIRRTIGELAGISPDQLIPAVDGCSAPAYALPLSALARAYENIANPEDLDEPRRAGLERLQRAVADHPVAYAGTGRFSTALLEAYPRALFPKNGAEAVFAIGFPKRELGVALKVEDGNDRGLFPVVVGLLQTLGFGPGTAAVEGFAATPIRTNRGDIVGHVSSLVDWSELSHLDRPKSD